MPSFTQHFTTKIWTITEAKARLSELLRLASDSPQYIGTKKKLCFDFTRKVGGSNPT